MAVQQLLPRVVLVSLQMLEYSRFGMMPTTFVFGSSVSVSSSALNDHIQSAADQAPAGPTVDFLRSLKLCKACNSFWRVGGNNDAGYVICADGLPSSGLSAVYSYGINGHDGYGNSLGSNHPSASMAK